MRVQYVPEVGPVGEHGEDLVCRLPSNDKVDLQSLFFDKAFDTTKLILFGKLLESMRKSIYNHEEKRLFPERLGIAQEESFRKACAKASTRETCNLHLSIITHLLHICLGEPITVHKFSHHRLLP